jgi:ammonia channel protein AmtB
MGIDDAVGAVTVHGTIGIFGLVMFGVWGAGLPALQGEGVATVSVVGQLVGAVVFFLLGFVPGYVVSLLLKMMGMLRVSEDAEILGLDKTKVPMEAYPEGIAPSVATPAE